MSDAIKSELQVIDLELKSIEESKQRIKGYIEELNKHNPFKVGEKLVGNDSTHYNKEFIVDRVYIAGSFRKEAERNLDKRPAYFCAEGYVLKKDKSLGVHRTTRIVPLVEKDSN